MNVNILYILFLIVNLNVTAGEFFFINKNGNPSLENVINNNVTNESIVLGKTYNIDGTNAYTLSTSINEILSLKFSDDVSVKLEPYTVLILNTLDQNILNASPYPEKLIHTNSLLSVTLMSGQLNVVNEGNNTHLNYISTSQVVICLNTGKFIIKADKGITMIVCIEGSAKVKDRLNSTHTDIINTNQTLVVIPAPVLSGKAAGLMRRQNMYSKSDLLDDQKLSFKESLNFEYPNILFMTFNGKVYGLRIR
jgi:hypothetical protein